MGLLNRFSSWINKLLEENKKKEQLNKRKEQLNKRKEQLNKKKDEINSALEKVNDFLSTDEGESFLNKYYKNVRNFVDMSDKNMYLANYNYIQNCYYRKYNMIYYFVDEAGGIEADHLYLDKDFDMQFSILYQFIMDDNSFDSNQLYDKELSILTIAYNIDKILFERACKKFNIKNEKDWLNEYVSNDTIDLETVENLSSLTDYVHYIHEESTSKWGDTYASVKKMVSDKILEKKKENIKNKLLKSNDNTNESQFISVEKIDNMTGEEFEQFIGKLFEKLGYKIMVTKISGDQGIDVIVEKKGLKTGIQCKRYSNKVSNSAIQEAVAGKAQYKLDKVMVITSNYFTRSAIELAASNNVTLWNREKLQSLIELIDEI